MTAWKRRRRTAFAAVMLVVVLANLVAWRHVHAMLHYRNGGVRTAQPEVLAGLGRVKALLFGVHLPRPRGTATPSDFGMRYESETIQAPHGVRLGAWFCPGATTSTVVVLFHGYGSDKTSLLDVARALHRFGLSTYLVDFRGSGESSENYTTAGYLEADDVAAAVARVRERFPGSRIILYGQSMGAVAVLRATDRLGVQPDGIIVEAVFDTILNTVRNRFRIMDVPSFPSAELLVFWGGVDFGFNGFRHNAVTYAGGVTCPVLVLHGTADNRARLEEAQRVYDALAGPKTFQVFEGSGHESYIARNPALWKQSVASFLGAPSA
jgi:alpha-beta hydrolase superfamily lysophospholipase